MRIVMSFPFCLIIRVSSGILKWQITYNISVQIKIYVLDDSILQNSRGCSDNYTLDMRFDSLLNRQLYVLQTRTPISQFYLQASSSRHAFTATSKRPPCMLLSSILSDCPLGGAESEMRRSLESSGSCSADGAAVTDIVYYLSVQKNLSPSCSHTNTTN